MKYSYEKNPQKIYAKSFATIQDEADLSALHPDLYPLALRLSHAAGDTDIIPNIRASESALQAGKQALKTECTVFCDSEMVAHGIIRRALPKELTLRVTLNDPQVESHAKKLGTTRSAAAVDLWQDEIAGAIVVIGNAPTALFHLLERLQSGWPSPALILGFPVGFVGATESKQALIESKALPFVTLLGRRGGSAIASAAFNALTLGTGGDGM